MMKRLYAVKNKYDNSLVSDKENNILYYDNKMKAKELRNQLNEQAETTFNKKSKKKKSKGKFKPPFIVTYGPDHHKIM